MKPKRHASAGQSGGGEDRDDERDELTRAMEGVSPLRGKGRVPPAPRAEVGPVRASVTAAAAGGEELPSEGQVAGLDPRVLRKLGRGEPAAVADLDLHGLHRDEAGRRVRAFLAESVAAGRRAVRIVHGRGLHSAGEPVLRTEVARVLHAALGSGEVLAFRPAPPSAGGMGAVHVLLRIKRR